MSLDVDLIVDRCISCGRYDVVYSGNITHNLAKMAEAAQIYKELWRPDELGIKYAEQLIRPLRGGLVRLRADPKYFKQFDSPNGWGTYKHFVPFVEDYLEACEQNPNAEVRVDR